MASGLHCLVRLACTNILDKYGIVIVYTKEFIIAPEGLYERSVTVSKTPLETARMTSLLSDMTTRYITLGYWRFSHCAVRDNVMLSAEKLLKILI